jgi:hypothetical protein
MPFKCDRRMPGALPDVKLLVGLGASVDLSDAGWHPQVLFRFRPRSEIEAAFDEWQQTTHGAQLIEAPGAVHFAYFASATDLPQAFRSGVSRMDYYTARDLDDLFTWMRSDELARGLSDADRWLGGLNEVDGQAFSANVYTPTTVSGPDPGSELPVFVERFEVTPGDSAEFDSWFRREHVAGIATQPGVARVRTFEAVRENVPIASYRSAGNRMLRAELASTSYRKTLMSAPLIERLESSMRWDRRLPYITRDVFIPLFSFRAHANR